MFALADCNNFYASCERVFNQKLLNQPIVVLSNQDGCVVARSNEAKKLGIPMGAPAFKYQEFFLKHGVYVFSSNYALYGDMSGRVMDLLSGYSPDIEIYSIDEAFLKFKGFNQTNFESYLLDIKQKVTRSTGIPISIGMGETKSLAKVANKVAKKFPDKTKGVYIIDTEEKRIKALKWLPVEDVWGIGNQFAKKLNSMAIYKAYDFTKLSSEWVKKNMSIVGLRLHKELNGESCLDLEEIKGKKSIGTTRSFDKTYCDYEKIKERVITFAVSCSEKLRKQKSCCNRLMVFIQTNYFNQNENQYSNSINVKLPYPTNSAIELSKFAIDALDRIYKNGYKYKRAGVLIMDFCPIESQQINLFNNSNPKHKKLMEIMDKINFALSSKKVKLSSQDLKSEWKMKQQKLSPRYTTNIKDIIIISL